MLKIIYNFYLLFFLIGNNSPLQNEANDPPNCDTDPTIVLQCEDSNPCTINDVEIILASDGSVCVPCMGTPLTCGNGPTTILPCDDGDPNSINDQETVLDCDGSICIPCQGTVVNCDTGPTVVLPCDDGNPCSINDFEVVLSSDGTICEPCNGTLVDCGNGSTSVLSCDDGNLFTINDELTIQDCDGSICIPCSGTCFNNWTFINGIDDFLSNDSIQIEVTNSIFSNNLITSGCNIIYDAGQLVEMNPGFEVEVGALFEAVIDGCD